MNISVFFILSVLVIAFIVVIITRSASSGGGRGGFPIMRGCPQCGESNPGQAAFCRKCGRALQ